VWTKEGLYELIQTRLSGYRLIVVSNREPYSHVRAHRGIECVRPASGMVTALDPILCACGGTWVAHGSGDADKLVVDAQDHVGAPPDTRRYTLRRVWLTPEEQAGYYTGLANEAMWPLCHIAFARPRFDPHHWECYRRVNELFANAVIEEAGNEPTFVFIHDFHLALLPQLLKQRNPNLIVAHFWHIPWPNPEVFRVFPWQEELLNGMMGNDLIGFHLRHHCQNFLDTLDQTVEARVDHVSFEVKRNSRVTLVRPFPIGIDYDEHAAAALSPAVGRRMAYWHDFLKLKNYTLGLGIDRIDYSKGIPERIAAIDSLLEQYPEFRSRLVFLQIGVPSRRDVPAYQQIHAEIESAVKRVNRRWSRGSWRPIVYLKQQFPHADMMALHQLASFCAVGSLHDGMNLVAKEFVASRNDEDGVLVLSRFAGASQELADAVIFNPYSLSESREAMRQALTMAPDERRHRMQRLRQVTRENNIYRWAGKILSTLMKLEFREVREEAACAASG
jgi:trehalose 6-phosphate synthase